MNRTPAFLCQWHHCRTLHTGQYSYDFFQFVFWSIHQYIFFIFSCFYCVHTEQQFFEHFFFLFAHVLVANQQCFRLHYNFHFFQAVADQSRTGTYNIKNGISQSNTRRHLYRTGYHMYFGIYAIFFQEFTKNNRIRGSNLLAFKP